MNMEFKRKLPTPQTIKDMYPVSETLAAQKEENDRQIRAVLTGEELVIYDKQLNPCAQLQEVSQAREVLMRSDGSAVLAGSMAASLYLP